MARYRQALIARLALTAITLIVSDAAWGQTTYVQDTDGNGAWNDGASWDNGIPNAVDAAAIINQPITTTGGSNYQLSLGNVATTVGSLTVNNTDGFLNTVIRDGPLVFQTSSGPATLTENMGVDDTDRNRLRIITPITMLSDLIINQNNDPQLNTSTEFTQRIDADAGKTLTKEGFGNLQLAFTGSLGATEGFLGNLVINNGAVRLIIPNNPPPGTQNTVFSKAAGVTVNAGGQFQFGNTITAVSLAPAAELKLNGTGKVAPAAAMNDGALRFENSATSGVVCTFDNPVNLQSAARVNVAAADVTGALTQVVHGVGELQKSGSGVLRLDAANTYAGGTTVFNGALDVNNTTGSGVGTGDVVVSGGTLGGTGVIGTVGDASNVSIAGGTLAPGALTTGFPEGLTTGPGILTAFGDLTLDSASSFNVDIFGSTLGAEYDQMVSHGAITLGGATLNLSLGAFTPTGTETFTLISNEDAGSVVGEFAGLSQGAGVDLAGMTFFIDYAGGTGGNDVVLSTGGTSPEDADFDQDGDVDGADFLTWQRNLGGAGGLAQGDANGDAAINGNDLAVWKSQFGPGGAGVGSVAAVPEPAALVLLACGVAAVTITWRRHSSICS